MSSFLEKNVVVGGSQATSSDDVHRDTSKPPRFTNVVTTLLMSEDRDGALADNRNSDAAHNIKVVGQGAGFPGGFACRVEFGTEYKNDKGESVAPMVALAADSAASSIQNTTPTGYDLILPLFNPGQVGHIRVAVSQPT